MSDQLKKPSDADRRNKRVQFIKKAIIAFLIIAVILPTALCVILFIRMNRLERQITELLADREEKSITATVDEVTEDKTLAGGKEQTDAVAAGILESSDKEKEAVEASSATIQEGKKKVFLTFDDGPSVYTDTILDICRSYQVKVTFFVVGKTGEKNEELYRRIVEEGHTIGMHSYSHKYSEIYESLASYQEDLEKLQAYIYEVTGVTADICRFPGGSSNTVSKVPMQDLIDYLGEKGIDYYDWNVSSGDASGEEYTAREIADNVLNGIESNNTSIVLMHDAADKTQTIEALPIIIEELLARDDVEILPITEDTAKIHHVRK